MNSAMITVQLLLVDFHLGLHWLLHLLIVEFDWLSAAFLFTFPTLPFLSSERTFYRFLPFRVGFRILPNVQWVLGQRQTPWLRVLRPEQRSK